MYEGYGRGRGEVVPEEPNTWEDDEDEISARELELSLPPPSADAAAIADWRGGEDEERDPNHKDGAAVRRFKENRDGTWRRSSRPCVSASRA